MAFNDFVDNYFLPQDLCVSHRSYRPSLFRGLVHYFNFRRPTGRSGLIYDVGPGRRHGEWFGATTYSRGGIELPGIAGAYGIYDNSAHQWYREDIGSMATTGDEYTFHCSWEPTTYATAERGIFQVAHTLQSGLPTFMIADLPNNGLNRRIRVYYNNTYDVTGYIPHPIARAEVTVSRRTGERTVVVINGVLQHTSIVGEMHYANAKFLTLGVAYAGYAATRFFASGTWSRALSLDEMQHLQRYPNWHVQPAPRPLVVGGGGGFRAAWATRRHAVIGGGLL